MIHFTRLRLSGFKSFVEPTDLVVAPGTTGVVGPNGCGKSNLVEALRWVMGETSAKQMRGGDMDDVIFGGTASRPPRNVAEVTVHLDNRSRTAPAIFNDHDELEITRRIERGSGSVYKVNGKEVRARDVQLLFADAATGARSTAMVSQGKIGALINAKPADRRALLEEAAGIRGLHSRRHEAQLRLNATEENLARLDDVLVTLDAQLQGLRRQAKQAARYRSISEQIRQAEAVLLHLRWIAALAALDEARAALRQAETEVGELTGTAASAATAQAEASAGLPALRQAEAEAAAKVQRLMVAREQLDAEEGRLAAAHAEQQRRLQQIDSDLHRATSRAEDAATALARLAEEQGQIEDAREGEEEEREIAAEKLEALAEAVAGLEAELARLTDDVAAAEAKRAAATRQLAEAEARLARLSARQAEIEAQREAAQAEAVPEEMLAEAEMRVEAAAEALEQAREQAEAAEQAKHSAQGLRDAARDALQAEAAQRARLRAEEGALADLLAEAVREGGLPPILDALTVTPGLEAALGAALGDDLSHPASEDEGQPLRWMSLPPLSTLPPLPAGAEPLAEHVRAPAALARRLSQIGVVASVAIGRDLRHDLAPGQRLVTREGDLWRWDGFTAAAGAPSVAATRLRQRNRLAELRAELEEAEFRVENAEARVEEASAAVEQAAEAERRARDQVRQAESEATQSRDALARLAQKAAASASRLASLDEAAGSLGTDIAEAQAQAEAARAQGEEAEGLQDGRERLALRRADLAERRAAQIEARAELERLTRAGEERRRRLDAIGREMASWRDRAAEAAEEREELALRREEALGEMERLAALPMEIADKRGELMDLLSEAEEGRAQAADALAAAEAVVAEADRQLKAIEKQLAAAREERVRREAEVAACAQACRAVAGRISEKLDRTPEQLLDMPEVAALREGGDAPDPDELDRRLARLLREREALGPVNLRAEQEVEELEAQIATLNAERDDLTAAIAKLRHAINELNREGRERLLASFQEVDRHFRDLFVRLFGGGRAHLALTESDDPLAAGLDIMASPPGKRLQNLSLLSGGEQALTALALLFGVFMTNPAPICVLDEVDAPLDDANVDRFCSLVGEMARQAQTRFLIITHHRMSMARMDRLFGVTMAERGVSTLVSVDLKEAERLRDTAPA